MEDRYEHIDILIKSPAGEESWFDRLFDFITSFCSDEGECTCGMESMGGSGGTLDQCYEHMRITEKWAQDVLADDLKLALHRLSADTGMDDEAYDRLRKAAYWHDDFNERYSNLEDDEEEETHLEHYSYCNCLADSAECCREGCWCKNVELEEGRENG
jgi:hypothetical protein